MDSDGSCVGRCTLPFCGCCPLCVPRSLFRMDVATVPAVLLGKYELAQETADEWH
jgi:hypothetical protein